MTERGLNPEQLDPRKELVVIIMGSPSDKDHADKIKETLDKFDIESHLRVSSAHKSTDNLLQMVVGYDAMDDRKIAYIAVAGRSNGLGPVLDGNTANFVLSSPPLSEEAFAVEDVWSSLRLPKGMAAPTSILPEASALAIVKHFALANPELATRYKAHQRKLESDIMKADLKFHPQP